MSDSEPTPAPDAPNTPPKSSKPAKPKPAVPPKSAVSPKPTAAPGAGAPGIPPKPPGVPGVPATPGKVNAPATSQFPAKSPASRPQMPSPLPPKRTSEEIRRDIEGQRIELGQSVDVLRDKVTELTDWRGQIRKHRRELVTGAAIAGFVIGGALALRRRR